jgi:hypothetical protein
VDEVEIEYSDDENDEKELSIEEIINKDKLRKN